MNNETNPIPPDDEDICVTLELDDGTQAECEILTIFEADGRDYIALLPVDENGEELEEGTVYIYRYIENEEGSPTLENILDDEELEAVETQFNDLLEEIDDAEE
ncbi:MAG: DUF1292 domain-containing protein [Eubacterium sp.]|jgi:uncharacterized protein YrzB (UPF0473 family)|nr:DUF1292 domain-containing protein [Eubacterium sp.]